MRLPVEIQPWRVLEFETSFDAVRSAADDHKRGHETDGLELFAELIGTPDLAVSAFQVFPAPRYDVDFDKSFTANRFSRITHFFPFLIELCLHREGYKDAKSPPHYAA